MDTPGIFDTDLSKEEVQRELVKALALSTPGFHVIAFVLMKGRFTDEIQKTQDIFFDWFGKGVEKFACVILTDTDNEKAKNEFIHNNPHEKLAHLVKACGGGENVVALNNRASDEIKEKQAESIFKVIDNIKQRNKGEYFTNLAYQLAEKFAIYKYPRELTQDSILLLEKASRNNSLSEKQCQYFDWPLEVRTEATKVIAETNIDSTKNSIGNLQIFDSSTNERISNIRKANQNEQVNTVNPSSSAAALPDTLSDSQRCLSSQVSKVPGRIAQENVDFQLSLEMTDEVTGFRRSEDVSGSDQIDHNAKVRKPNLRKGRKCDPDSVRYYIPPSPPSISPTPTPPSHPSPVNTLKKRVNNEENSKELQGLLRYLREALRYCKQKFCVLL